ncbi:MULTISPECIES: hypothetical protein [unclassified Micromonospora]|uniref:hypothetical protein n=1 Tax=unclassified Micromonospora TaxID=2617518 RepID=UPI003A87348F
MDSGSPTPPSALVYAVAGGVVLLALRHRRHPDLGAARDTDRYGTDASRRMIWLSVAAFGPRGFRETRGPVAEVRASDQARDPGNGRRMWAAAARLTGVTYL